MASSHAHASAQGTGELTQADNASAASGALTGRDALLANLGGDALSSTRQVLESQRQQVLPENKVVAKSADNAQRQWRRLKRNANNLSTDDLVEVLTMRSVGQNAKAHAFAAVAAGTCLTESME